MIERLMESAKWEGGDVHSRNNIPAAIRPDQASAYGRLTMTGE